MNNRLPKETINMILNPTKDMVCRHMTMQPLMQGVSWNGEAYLVPTVYIQQPNEADDAGIFLNFLLVMDTDIKDDHVNDLSFNRWEKEYTSLMVRWEHQDEDSGMIEVPEQMYTPVEDYFFTEGHLGKRYTDKLVDQSECQTSITDGIQILADLLAVYHMDFPEGTDFIDLTKNYITKVTDIVTSLTEEDLIEQTGLNWDYIFEWVDEEFAEVADDHYEFG